MASGTARCREIKKVIKGDDIKRNVQLAGSLLTFLSISSDQDRRRIGMATP